MAKKGSDPLNEAARNAVEGPARYGIKQMLDAEKEVKRSGTAAESRRLMEAVTLLAFDRGVSTAVIYRQAVREFVERNPREERIES